VIASSVTSPLERQFGQVPPSADDLHELRWQLGHHPPIQSQTEYRCRRTAGPTGHQSPLSLFSPKTCRTLPFIAKPIQPTPRFLTLALTSKALPLSKFTTSLTRRFVQKISQLPGVGLVSISGGQKPAVRIQLTLPPYRLTPSIWRMSVPAITAANVNLPREISTVNARLFRLARTINSLPVAITRR